MTKDIFCIYCLENKDKPKIGEHPIPDSCGSDITTTRVCNTCNQEANDKVDSEFVNMKYIEFLRSILGITTKDGIVKVHQQRINFTEENGNKTTGKLIIKKVGNSFELHPKVIDTDTDTDKKEIRFFNGQDYQHHIKAILKDSNRSGIKMIGFDVERVISNIKGNLTYEIDTEIIKKELIKAAYALATIYLDGFEHTRTGEFMRSFWKGDDISQFNIVPDFQLAIFDDISIDTAKEILNNTSYNHLFSCVKEENGDINLLLCLFNKFTVGLKLLPSCSKQISELFSVQCKAIIIDPVTRETRELNI